MTRICVLGLGEVGLRLAALLCGPENQVTGVDTAPARRALAAGSLEEAGYDFSLQNFTVSEQPHKADVFFIAVDTPLNENLLIADLTNLEAAAASVAEVISPGNLVVIRSTVPVGTSRSLIDRTISSQSRLSPAEYRLCFAPDRSSTGGSLREAREIHHLIGGRDDASLAAASRVFALAGLRTVSMESLEAAELGKLASNATRDVYQAVANQLAAIASDWNIDCARLVHEVNHDYPRDRIKQPSPGVGGSCLTKDSYFLAQSLAARPETTLFGVARTTNDNAPQIVLDSLSRFLKAGRGEHASVLICGAAFKGVPPTKDTRRSVGLEMARSIQAWKVDVRVHDPVVEESQVEALGFRFESQPFNGTRWDAVLLASNHRSFFRNGLAQTILDSLRNPGYIYDPHAIVSGVVKSTPTELVYRRISSEQRLGQAAQ